MTEGDEPEYALEMARVGKRFGANWVLRNVDLKVRRGSIHAIVGHNGAGKSTLMKIALGAETPTEGEVRIGGRRLTFARPAEARTFGLGMVMQERSLIETMTGIDNLFLNAELQNALGCVDIRRERAEIDQLTRQLGIRPSSLSLRVSDLSMIERELLEIARALRLGNQVLVLDEPTAALSRDEIGKLFEVLGIIAAQGTGIVLITHHLAEVFQVSTEVTCLREGKVTLSCTTQDTSMAHLIAAMLGQREEGQSGSKGRVVEEGHDVPSRAAAGGGERTPALTVRHLRVGTTLSDVSLDAFAGEILGIAGLAGSGRSTLLRTLFGDARPSAGEIRLEGIPYRPKSPSEAIAVGVFLIPQDRGVHGLVLSKSIFENIMLVLLRRLSNWLRFLKFSDGRKDARRMIGALDIRGVGMHQPVNELSGGNQQKVVLAKALTLESRLLLLDEPTFGVDITATRAIIMQVRNLADRGAIVLWASSDLLEMTSVCDRIAILRNGIVSAIIAATERHAFNERALWAAIERS